jgi:two-component system cell cycle response regulator
MMDDTERAREEASRFRLLVVDDESSLRGILSELLGEAGYYVETAESGEEALDRIRNSTFHVVITDIRLGGMNGIELIRLIRGMGVEAEVIVMTSHASFSTAVEALRLGAYDYLMKPFEDLDAVLALVKRTIDKLRLVMENRNLVENLKRKNEELEDLNRSIRELAVRDGLTGLYNYRYLQEVLHTEVSRSERHGFSVCVLMVDVDHFKHYNDHNGHLDGDDVLKIIGHILGERARRSDTVARYGGEEFCVILPETRADFGMKVAEDVRQLVESYPFQSRQKQPLGKVTISLGIAEFPVDADSARALIDRADQALYRAKTEGRNRVRLYRDAAESPGAPPQAA